MLLPANRTARRIADWVLEMPVQITKSPGRGPQAQQEQANAKQDQQRLTQEWLGGQNSDPTEYSQGNKQCTCEPQQHSYRIGEFKPAHAEVIKPLVTFLS